MPRIEEQGTSSGTSGKPRSCKPRVSKDLLGLAGFRYAKRKSRSLAPVRDHRLRPLAAGKHATELGMTDARGCDLSPGSISGKFICWAAMLALIFYDIAGCAGTTNPTPALQGCFGRLGWRPAIYPNGSVPARARPGIRAATSKAAEPRRLRASTDVAHRGNFSAKLTITTPSTPDSGTRFFSWLQPQTYPDLYYRAWYYFPQRVTPSGNPASWNVM
jgi:hypothetical protein